MAPTSDADNRHEQFRGWIMFLTGLAATVTFTAGHAPPGGFWSADDKAKGYVAGTSVMRDKFHCRYLVFYYSNSAAFFLSMAVIVMLVQLKKEDNQTVRKIHHVITFLVSACIACLGTTYIAGLWDSPVHGKYGMVMFTIALFFMSLHWIMGAVTSTKNLSTEKREDPNGSSQQA